jgi:membrane protein YdbS with pleckstrin-like domain
MLSSLQRMETKPVPPEIRSLERPCSALWKYYVITAVLTGPGLIGALPYLWFRYYTLRFRFDEEGIHMRVGILFRREVNLTYARIQDIHLRSNFLQRWLGLANVQIQTASGSAGAELVIEGFREFEAIRDFLYTRMRGYQAQPHSAVDARNALVPAASIAVPPANENSEMVSLLLSIRDELRRTREALESRKSSSSASPPASSSSSHV